MTELQYIVDAQGQRTAVILPIEEYEALIAGLEEVDDPEMVSAIDEAQNSPRVTLDRLIQLVEKQN
jgi:hypothetical protein